MVKKNGEAIVHNGWIVQESGLSGADHAVLMLPGALESAQFYDDVLKEPALAEAPVRFVVTTLPGYAGAPVLNDLTMENIARSAGQLAADFGCDVVVGHSVGANVALEMAAAGEFSGRVVLLSPSFSRKDESKFPRTLDYLGRVFGHIPFSLIIKMIGPAMKGSLPSGRAEALIAEMKKNDPRDVRRNTHHYLEYLDRHGSLVSRLGESGARTWVVFGEYDEVKLSEDERRGLGAYNQVTLVTIPDTGHFTLVDKSAQVAQLVLEAVLSAPSINTQDQLGYRGPTFKSK